MGIDYSGVGGVGIELTDEMVENAIMSGLFTQEEWDEYEYICLEKLGVTFGRAGSEYDGYIWYLFVDGETLDEVIQNRDKFVSTLAGHCIEVKNEDLKIISDLLVW